MNLFKVRDKEEPKLNTTEALKKIEDGLEIRLKDWDKDGFVYKKSLSELKFNRISEKEFTKAVINPNSEWETTKVKLCNSKTFIGEDQKKYRVIDWKNKYLCFLLEIRTDDIVNIKLYNEDGTCAFGNGPNIIKEKHLFE